jgi:hypothetical protein
MNELRDLLCQWDPIGVMRDFDGPCDEYDCLIGPLLSMLDRNVTLEQVDDFLKHELDVHFGLGSPQKPGLEDISAKICEWYKKYQKPPE